MEQKPHITIEVSGGMVQNVYTSLETDVDVDILDFDDNGMKPAQERCELQEYLDCVVSGQRQIY